MIHVLKNEQNLPVAGTVGAFVGFEVVGSIVLTFVGMPEGKKVGDSEGSSVGENDGLPVLGFVGERVGENVPIMLRIATSVVLHIVTRLSSIAGDLSGSISIAASEPTQQFGIFDTSEQKQDP